MHQLVKIVPLLLVCAILTFALPGCGNTTATVTNDTQTLTDHLDRTVTVPADPQKVISLHPIGTEIVYCLQAQDKLIAVDTYSATLPMSTKIGTKNKNLAAFETEGYHIEDILAMKPDLVIGTAYYPEEIQKLADAGLTVIAFDFHGRTTDEEIQLIGAALGKNKEAQKLIDYRAAIAEKIAAIVDTIPQEQRKDIFYLRYAGSILKTASVNTFEHELITKAGGINLGKDITTGKWVEASWEQLLLWDPDVVMSAPLISTGEFITVDELKTDVKWSQIRAVKTDDVWVMPIGYFKMDCSAPENCLGLEYLATKLYPEKFDKINLGDDIKDFFKTFYHYNLADDELASILQPQGIQMGNN